MDKQQAMTLAYWIMIIVVVVTCFFIMAYLQSNASQCVADPLNYYNIKTGEQCWCMMTQNLVP